MPNPITKIKTSDDVVHDIEVDLSDYYDKSETDLLLSAKADDADTYSKEEVQLALATKANVNDVYDKAAVNHLLDDKADKSNTYTEIEVDTLLLAKADKSDTYTKTEVDTALGGKADVGDSYTKAEDDALLATKADVSTTYTKTEVDNALALKADASTTYTKTEVDTALALKANVGDSYTKAEDDALLAAIMPIGIIVPFGGTNAPNGWLLCVGNEVSKTTYSALYGVIGDAYGTAVDPDNFVLPDMRECVPKGAGLYGGTVGAHVDIDGLALGEFLDDRVLTHRHESDGYTNTTGSGSVPLAGLPGSPARNNNYTFYMGTGVRHGDTNEVKSIGVNYIIKY